jgi:hypothetical protein
MPVIIWGEALASGAMPGEQRSKHEVHIRLEGYAARIVAERQWHPTQAIRKIKPDGSIIEFQADLPGWRKSPAGC